MFGRLIFNFAIPIRARIVRPTMTDPTNSTPAANQSERHRLWAVTLVAMGVPSVAALVYFVLFKESKVAQPIYAATKIFEVLWPFAAAILILRRPLAWREKPLRHHLAAVSLGLAVGLGIAGIMAAWMFSPYASLIEAAAPLVKAKVKALGFADHFIPFAVFVTVAHSFLEEFYWRWFVYGNLRHLMAGPRAHLLAALAFASHHLIVTSQFFPFPLALFFAFCVAIGGYLWSQLYERQLSLAGAWASHLIVDAGLMVIGWHLLQL
jgi:membrane protease YdiL (CAAX protease family)